MVMEYVQGKTLNDLIPKGGLRVPLLIKYALQMADALSTAHAAGIVHRDLKPANAMVTESGLVKILDFGLAKLTDRGPVPDTGDDRTRTIANVAPMTVEGSILGTVSYMSPEQAQGKKVDTRSDIFSFGAVLYEMATGVRAFEGESSLSTLSAILRDEAKPMSEVAPDVPPQLETVIQRCLRKNPDDRWQSMKDVQSALSALKRESDSGSLYTTRLTAPAAPPSMGPASVKTQAAVSAPANASSFKFEGHHWDRRGAGGFSGGRRRRIVHDEEARRGERPRLNWLRKHLRRRPWSRPNRRRRLRLRRIRRSPMTACWRW